MEVKDSLVGPLCQSRLVTCTYFQVRLTLKTHNQKFYRLNYSDLFVDFIFQIIGLFRPIYRQTKLSDNRIVAHKSIALAAQNFMISMAAINYDTCPMEGTDTLRIKKILNLPSKSEINMVIGCGIRDEKGLYNKQFRVPFEKVYSHY